MTITPLTALEAASCGFTHKLVITAADVVTLTSGVAASIFPGFNGTANFPANCILDSATAFVKTAFAGGTGTLTFGISDGTNQIINTGTDLKTVGPTTYNLTKPVGYSSASKISITVTAGTGITGWTSGELDVFINFVDLNTLAR